MQEKCKALNALLQSDEPDQARAMELADEMGRLKAQILKSRIHSVLRVRRTLTADQLKVLLEGE